MNTMYNLVLYDVFKMMITRVVNGADWFRPEPGPNPKTNLKIKSCPKKNESKVRSEKFSNVAK